MDKTFKFLAKIILLLLPIFVNACINDPEKQLIVEKTPWGEETFTYPSIGNTEYPITSFGAKTDIGYNNQQAIQKAIDKCSSDGGGIVVVPSGTWETSYLTIKSRVNLHLEKGAVLSFSDSIELYNTPTYTRWEGIECMNYHPLIYAKDAHDIALTGEGKINGNGEKWWKYKKIQHITIEELYTQVLNDVPPNQRNCLAFDSGSYLRPSLIQFIDTKNVWVDGIEIMSGPMWTLHFVYCENVIAQDIRVITHGVNNDGLIPDSSKKILIDNCFFSTGDDCIVIKSGLNEDGWRVGKPSERIIIKNCYTQQGHGGVVIGSEMSGGVKNIYAHDCNFSNTQLGLRIKSMEGRGGYVKNLWLENIRMDSIRDEAIQITMKYGASSIEPRNNKTPDFSNFNFKDIKSSYSKYCIRIVGLEDQKIDSLTFEGLEMHGENGIVISNTENSRFSNIEIEADYDEPVQLTGCRNIHFNESQFKANSDTMINLRYENSNITVSNSNIEDFKFLFNKEIVK